jgi:hypothetical protein
MVLVTGLPKALHRTSADSPRAGRKAVLGCLVVVSARVACGRRTDDGLDDGKRAASARCGCCLEFARSGA